MSNLLLPETFIAAPYRNRQFAMNLKMSESQPWEMILPERVCLEVLGKVADSKMWLSEI